MANGIVDSHIHLYAASHLKDLAWTSQLPVNHVLNTQNSVDQYYKATAKTTSLRGFVFVETDRKSGLSEDDWKYPLEEIGFLGRIKGGRLGENEGHDPHDGRLVLGIVPWVPILAGKDSIQEYVRKANEALRQHCDSQLIKGFRYLAQDKPKGTLLDPKFLEGLLTLDELGFQTFDLGVDARQGGLWQLHEACGMLDQFYAKGDCKLKIIINHLCKPNLRLSAAEVKEGNQGFLDWKLCVTKLAAYPTTYIKLSGLFSELPPQEHGQPSPVAHLLEITKPWLDVIFETFGSSRIMYGSDWPVCNVEGPGSELSWQHWHDFVAALLMQRQLTEHEISRVWADTAIEAYGIGLN